MVKVQRLGADADLRRQGFGEEEAILYEPLRWPIYEYEIVEKPSLELAHIWKQDWEQYGAPWPPGGVFVPKGLKICQPRAGGHPRPELVYITGGRLWPDPLRWYDVREKSEEILQDVSRLDTSDPDGLLTFVNRWGSLRLRVLHTVLVSESAEPEARQPSLSRPTTTLSEAIRAAIETRFDGVTRTGGWLAQLKAHIEILPGLQRGRAQCTWKDYASDLTERLREVHLAARPGRTGLLATYAVATLPDALYLRLWELATEGNRLRRCRWCQSLFIPDRRDQRYCKTDGVQRCARRASLTRFRRRQKRQ